MPNVCNVQSTELLKCMPSDLKWSLPLIGNTLSPLSETCLLSLMPFTSFTHFLLRWSCLLEWLNIFPEYINACINPLLVFKMCLPLLLLQTLTSISDEIFLLLFLVPVYQAPYREGSALPDERCLANLFTGYFSVKYAHNLPEGAWYGETPPSSLASLVLCSIIYYFPLLLSPSPLTPACWHSKTLQQSILPKQRSIKKYTLILVSLQNSSLHEITLFTPFIS